MGQTINLKLVSRITSINSILLFWDAGIFFQLPMKGHEKDMGNEKNLVV